MNILSFERFKLLLEAEGDAPEETPVEPPAAEESPAPAEPAPAPAEPAPAPDASAPATVDPLASLSLPADPTAPAAPTSTASLKLVFLNNDHPWHSQYADGGGVKRFKEYEILQADLEKWITENGLDAKKDEIIQAANGKKSIDPDTFTKLKSALSAGKFGTDRGDVDVEFDNNNSPSTNKLDLIFIKAA